MDRYELIDKRTQTKQGYEYKDKVDFIDTLQWQQSVRRKNVEMI